MAAQQGLSGTNLHSYKSHYAVELASSATAATAAAPPHAEDSVCVIGPEDKENQLQVVLMEYSREGCEVVIVGSRGEILCLDSLSAATIWAVPGHMIRLQQAHLRKAAGMPHVQEVVLVDEDGLVRRRCLSRHGLPVVHSLCPCSTAFAL